MHSFAVKIDDAGAFGIDETFSLFASDIVEAAIKALDILNALHENIRKAAQEDSDFPLEPEIVKIAYISDEGVLTGGETIPGDNWAQDFADAMTVQIKKYLC
jgi:hypothetical protein